MKVLLAGSVNSIMVISHEHKYLFIEIPLTASWAVRNELCRYYGGEPILHKHATVSEFKRRYPADHHEYFVFAAVRNPLDQLVSRYLKMKNDHKGAFSSRDALRSMKLEHADLEQFRFIQENDASFPEYFKMYQRRPFSTLLDLSGNHLDFVIRYEHLQRDFSVLLKRLGLEKARQLPVVNRTRGKGADWITYYTPEIVDQVKATCGPYMSRWGYEFPGEWGRYSLSWRKNLEYVVLGWLRKVYVEKFRYNENMAASTVRWLRSQLVR